MMSNKRRRYKQKIWHTIARQEAVVRFRGGVFYERVPWRWLAITRVYPGSWAEIVGALETFTVEITSASSKMVLAMPQVHQTINLEVEKIRNWSKLRHSRLTRND